MNTEYTAFDLFPGLGSMSLAAQYSGFEVVGALDWQEKARDVYEKNFTAEIQILSNPEEEECVKAIAEADVLIGRLPYSVFRIGRKQAGKTLRTNQGEYYWAILTDIIVKKRPRAFVFSMSAKAGKEEYWKNLVGKVLQEHYRIDWELLDTREITGYPVDDRRIFLVGIRRDMTGKFTFPKRGCKRGYEIEEFLDDEAEAKDSQYGDDLFPEAYDESFYDEPGVYCWSGGQYGAKERLGYNAWKRPLLRTARGLRKMSNHEIARTKGFPDEFCLNASAESWIYRRLCDSVNVAVATAVLRQVYFCLADIWPDEARLPTYMKKNSDKDDQKKRETMEDKVFRYFKEETVQQYKSDIGFRTLVESVNENMYIIPKYQRKYRWKKEQLIGLVESLLRGLPIPPIYTCRNSANQLEILDGQQRVMSLFFYYIGYFMKVKKNSSINFSELEVGDSSFADALLKKYELEKLHVNLKGMNEEEINVDYAALPVEIRRKVDYTMITVIEIKIAQEERREEILQTIFSYLNKNGSILTRQEQRNGIYTCEFYDMLQSFNRKNQKWRRLWGREDAKDRDLEMLLRLCALKKYIYVEKEQNNDIGFKIEGYFGSYAEMLDRFSKEATAFRKKEIAEYKGSLECFVELFETSNVLSLKAPLLEGFYVLHEKLGIQKKISKTLIEKVWNDPKYKENNRQRTVNIRKMRERWKAVYEIWNGFSD